MSARTKDKPRVWFLSDSDLEPECTSPESCGICHSCQRPEPHDCAVPVPRALLERVEEAMAACFEEIRSGQVCYRSHNGIPMGMSKKQERLVRAALAELRKVPR